MGRPKTTGGVKNCEYCGIVISSKSYKRHVETKHVLSTKFDCKICRGLFATAQNLRRHVENVHHKRTFACDMCDAKLSAASALARHKREIHQGNIRGPPKVEGMPRYTPELPIDAYVDDEIGPNELCEIWIFSNLMTWTFIDAKGNKERYRMITVNRPENVEEPICYRLNRYSEICKTSTGHSIILEELSDVITGIGIRSQVLQKFIELEFTVIAKKLNVLIINILFAPFSLNKSGNLVKQINLQEQPEKDILSHTVAFQPAFFHDHFYLIIYQIKNKIKRAFVLDSLVFDGEENCDYKRFIKEQINSTLRSLVMQSNFDGLNDKDILFRGNIVRQAQKSKNSADCGLFVIFYMNYIMNGLQKENDLEKVIEGVPSKLDDFNSIGNRRSYFVKKILENSDLHFILSNTQQK